MEKRHIIKTENITKIYHSGGKPFKLFWVIPMKINSQYIIDSENGEIIKSKSSWFSIFGKNVGLRDLLAVRNQFGDTIKRWKVELYAE